MKVYSFLNTLLLINSRQITGWADGDDIISAKRSVDSASHKVGADGQMVVSISADRSGEFTFKLLKTSDSNAYLNSLFNRQELAGAAGFVPVGVLMQDTFRQDRASGDTGYLKAQPAMTGGEKATTQEWTVVVERLDLVFGTSPDVLPA